MSIEPEAVALVVTLENTYKFVGWFCFIWCVFGEGGGFFFFFGGRVIILENIFL